MKCAACGNDNQSALPFAIMNVRLEDGSTCTFFACHACGTLRMELIKTKEVNRFDGCVCPWCGNTHHSEFAISTENYSFGDNPPYQRFKMECSCGASGPHEDTAEKAVERFKAWGKK